MKNHLSLVWHGKLPLQKVLLEWAVLGGLAVNMVSSALFLLLIVNDYLIAALIAGYGVSIPYNFLVSVGVWRSADRYSGEKFWADLARFLTVIGMVLLSIT